MTTHMSHMTHLIFFFFFYNICDMSQFVFFNYYCVVVDLYQSWKKEE